MGTVWWASGAGPLAAYAAGYRRELERCGFSPRAVRDRMEVAGQLDRWLAAEGLAAAGLTAARAGQFFAALRAAGQRRVPAMPALAPLFAYLRDQQVLPPEQEPATPTEELLASYRRYLAVERGVAPLTALRYERMARRFLLGRIARAGGRPGRRICAVLRSSPTWLDAAPGSGRPGRPSGRRPTCGRCCGSCT